MRRQIVYVRGTVTLGGASVKHVLEAPAERPYPHPMRDLLEPAVAGVRATLDAVADPIERYEATREVEKEVRSLLKDVRRRIALELKNEHGKTWREVGQIMGNVTAQRAEQISRGA